MSSIWQPLECDVGDLRAAQVDVAEPTLDEAHPAQLRVVGVEHPDPAPVDLHLAQGAAVHPDRRGLAPFEAALAQAASGEAGIVEPAPVEEALDQITVVGADTTEVDVVEPDTVVAALADEVLGVAGGEIFQGDQRGHGLRGHAPILDRATTGPTARPARATPSNPRGRGAGRRLAGQRTATAYSPFRQAPGRTRPIIHAQAHQYRARRPQSVGSSSASQGSTYTCPFCQYAAKDLRPHGHDFAVLKERQVVGGGVRPSACYSCGSSDRERLIYFYLKDERGFFTEPQHKKVLHIAPEKRLSRYMLGVGFGEYVCGDLFTEGYDHPAHVRNIDVNEIPFEDDTFDLILCNHVLEHIPTDDVAMKELRPGPQARWHGDPPGARSPPTRPTPSRTSPSLTRRSASRPSASSTTSASTGRTTSTGWSTVDSRVERVNLSEKYARYGVNPDEELFVCSK